MTPANFFSALFISNDPSIFNAQSSTRERMRSYAKEIGALHIISHTNGKEKYEQEDLGDGCTLTLYPIKNRKPFSFMVMTVQARKVIRDQKIQVVSAQDPFEYGRVAMNAVKGTDAKLHIQIHTDFLSPWFTRGKTLRSAQIHMPAVNRVRQPIADRVLPKADGIRAVSQRVLDSIKARYGDKIIPYPSMIPIAVPLEVPPAVPLPPHDFSFALITVGRLEPEKRIEDIVAAMAQVHMKYPMVGLIVVGDGSERPKIESYANGLGLSDRVLFMGNREDAFGLMQSAQAYIQASAYEGYSRTLVEAALARVPIITTDVGIVGEVFKGYEDVLVSPPGDAATLATHIKGLVEDNHARKEFSIAAEKAARDHLASVHTTPADIAADLRSVFGK
jgi:glycosyltransferase involved in cell wall biosynthesis